MSWQNLSQMFEETYWINKEQEEEVEKSKSNADGTKVKKEEKSMTLKELEKVPGMGKLE